MEEARKTRLRETLERLVAKFEKNLHQYKSPSYLEANVQTDFINSLFEGLGWDVRDDKNLGPRRCEVVLEKGESGNRPDYNFRIDGEAVFYVETKRPAEDLDNVKHILQAKGYAWSERKVNVVALTDFEEFRLFDATLKPEPRYPDRGEIFRFHYTEYIDNLDKLLVLHRDAVAEGSLDEILLQDRKSKQLRKPPDKAFLEDLNRWRLKLAKGLYKKSGYAWDDYAITEAVQRFLDRVIFIRIAEERDIIEPRQLQDKVEYWKNSRKKLALYEELLLPLFKTVNDDLDGDLFKPGAADRAPFDDEDVADVIEELYPPASIYRFDALPIEIIGAAYEQYLGNAIRCTPKQVKLEPKPEVRKAGGVYYTPKYIVNYIVANTVGKLVEGKTPEQVEELKILDPACGSGSFLIGALEYLIRYVEDYYQDHSDKVRRDELFPYLVDDYETGETRLSIERKISLLENCIYGVDIDAQAVEVTKLSLYLKVLERERRLPVKRSLLDPLDKNIKWGNSLIGSDYEGFLPPDQLDMFRSDLEEQRRVNPFDWDVGFPDIVKYKTGTKELADGYGFDAVIGNPPWVRGVNITTGDFKYFEEEFTSVTGQPDLYVLFVEKSSTLTKRNGLFSFIVPRFILFNLETETIRETLYKQNQLIRVVDSASPFEGVSTESIVYVCKNAKEPDYSIDVLRIDYEGNISNVTEIPKKHIAEGPNQIINILYDPVFDAILRKVRGQRVAPLKDLCSLKRGMEIGKKKLRSTESGYKALIGEDTTKYLVSWEGTYVEETEKEAKRLKSVSEKEKILVRRVASSLIAAIDFDSYHFSKNLYALYDIDTSVISRLYLLGLLNSRLMLFYFINYFTTKKVAIFPEVQAYQLSELPIRPIDFSDPTDVAKHDRMVELVDRMLKLHRDLAAARSDADRNLIDREIKRTDKAIDVLVYEMYGLTEEEINVVEGAGHV